MQIIHARLFSFYFYTNMDTCELSFQNLPTPHCPILGGVGVAIFRGSTEDMVEQYLSSGALQSSVVGL
jgi:hypothetical protein